MFPARIMLMGNESVQKIIIYGNNFFPETAISNFVISNDSSFRVLFDIIASDILFQK